MYNVMYMYMYESVMYTQLDTMCTYNVHVNMCFPYSIIHVRTVYIHTVCTIYTCVLPLTCVTPSPPSLQIKQRRSSGDAEENILRFLQACTTLGIKKVGLWLDTIQHTLLVLYNIMLCVYLWTQVSLGYSRILGLNSYTCIYTCTCTMYVNQ